MAAEEKYRRLPGRKRGVGTSATMWMGSDHILLVRSAWFREEYKRFYLRDIQAIVVADCARFHFSAPMLWFTLAWLIALAALPSAYTSTSAWWYTTSALVVAWFAISLTASCRCRLYTAVSKDELPSLYRAWSARRFMREVLPLITQAQGAVDAAWADAERTSAGPAVAAQAPPDPQPRRALHAHTLAADLFVLSLFVGLPAVGFATAHTAYTGWFQINSGLTLLQLAGAIAVLVQYARGGLVKAMQRLAIAALILIGITFYVQTFTYSLTVANETSVTGGKKISAPRQVVAFHEVTNGAGLLLGLIGVGIILRGRYGYSAGGHDPDIIKD